MHVRCPHCHQPLEVISSGSLQDLSCPSCGSSFNLLGPTEGHEASTASYVPTVRTLGRFQIEELLGQGHFGSVYRARDPELDRVVAIKIPRRDQLGPEEAELFFREARAAAQLRHPGIVAVHEIGRDLGTTYIVSDFVQGVDLAQWLTARRPTAQEAAELGVQIADALHYAHQAGIVHRDLKPSNIILDADGTPHVMDFGLAKREAGEITMTVEGKVLGTPAYMSPEQAAGHSHNADRRSDVYSLGVILFELLTGERPFRGATRMLLHQVIHEDAPGPRKLSSQVPQDLDTICLKCLEKDPDRRYQTAAALADDLRRWRNREPIHARAISPAARAVRWCHKRPLIAGLLVLVVLLTAVAVGGTSWQWHWAVVARKAAEEQRGVALKQKEEADQLRLDAQRSERIGRQRLYAAEMNLAFQALREKNFTRLLELLERHRPHVGERDQRGFEWYYLWRQAHLESVALFGLSKVQQIAFSATGQRLAAVGGDRLLVWSTNDWLLVDRLRPPDGELFDVAYSPDGRFLVAGGRAQSGNGTVHVWDAGSHALLGSFPKLRAVVYRIDVSPQSDRVAAAPRDLAGSGWELQVGDLENRSWQVALKGHTAPPSDIAFTRDGRTVVSAAGGDWMAGEAIIWDLESHEPRHSLSSHLIGTVQCLALSPDGATLATSGYVDQQVKLWDIATGKELSSWTAPSVVRGLAFAPDANLIAGAGSDGVLRFWNREGAEQFSTAGNLFPLTCAAYAADGQTIVAGSAGLATGTPAAVRVWSLPALDGRADRLEGHHQMVASLAFSDDGRRLATGSGDQSIGCWDLTEETPQGNIVGVPQGACVRFLNPDLLLLGGSREPERPESRLSIWKVPELTPLASWSGHSTRLRCLARSPNRRLVASGSRENGEGEVILWRTEVGGESLDLQPLELEDSSGPANWVDFSPDGRLLAASGWQRQLRIWEVESRQIRHRLGDDRLTWAVRFAPDGEHLVMATGGHDAASRIEVWNLQRQARVGSWQAHGLPTRSLAFSRDGRTLASGSDTIRLWHWATQREVGTLSGHLGSTLDVVFSPDGKTLASAGEKDFLVRLWRAAPDQEQGVFRGHEGRVVAAAFTPDGRLAATAGFDHQILIWELSTGKILHELEGHQAVVQELVFSSDGTTLYSASYDKTVRAWNWRKQQHRIVGEGLVYRCLKLLPGETRLAVGGGEQLRSGGRVQVWDIGTGELDHQFDGFLAPVYTLASDREGRFLVTGSAGLESGEVRWVALDPSSPPPPQPIDTGGVGKWSVALTHDGATLIGGGDDNSVRLWESATGEERERLTGHTGSVDTVALSPDGRLLATGSYDQTVRIWDWRQGTLLRTLRGHTFPVRVVRFSPDGRTLISGAGGSDRADVTGTTSEVKIWRVTPLPGTPPAGP